MSDQKTVLTQAQIHDEQLADWSVVDQTLTATFETGDFATGLQLVARLGEAAEAANHHPDVELGYPRVTVHLTSHDVGGITSRDTDLAASISGLAGQLGVEAQDAD